MIPHHHKTAAGRRDSAVRSRRLFAFPHGVCYTGSSKTGRTCPGGESDEQNVQLAETERKRADAGLSGRNAAGLPAHGAQAPEHDPEQRSQRHSPHMGRVRRRNTGGVSAHGAPGGQQGEPAGLLCRAAGIPFCRAGRAAAGRSAAARARCAGHPH